MINNNLKLNPKLFDETIERTATRNGFGKGLLELGEENKNVVVLTADLAESTKVLDFAKKFPERFFECGVAEQNMAAIASGLATSSKTAFISSYAVFSPGKNWETIRTTIVYNNANVKIAGHHAGIITGPDGATHQATEDIASIRAWPNIKIICPCDSIEAKKATLASGKTKGPFYLRFSREKTPIITTDETSFDMEKIQVFWQGKNPKVVIFATGHIVYQALLAAKELEGKIDVLVANVATLKPIDEKTVIELAKKTGRVVTCEDHQTAGGLGGIIAETLASEYPSPIEFIGLKDTFAESGSALELMKKYELDKNAIIKAVKKVLIK